MDLMRGNSSYRSKFVSSGIELLALYLPYHYLSAELFIDVHTAIDDTHNDDTVILNGVENQVGPDDGAAKPRGEAGPFAPDEGEPGELIELLVDPGENLFGSKRTALFDIRSKQVALAYRLR
jgi:hypothetical protein